ncbi:MAG TPA: hypothetical protein VI876_12810 [Dehalococcoidia bacterium]|nr:hypothetical protein [Dehalococcoidia bacterium]
MGQRILELVFRHKFLLALPVTLGLIGGLFALSFADSSYYVSFASIWVERPTDVTGGSFSEFNVYASPAQNQAGSMRELLGINAFASDILARADGGENLGLTLLDLRRNTHIYPGGDHVLYVEHRSDDPEQARRTVQAIVDEYASLYTAQIKDKALRAKEFYGEQLSVFRGALEQASAELRSYIALHPPLATVDLDDPPSSALRDVEFARLIATEQTARENYDLLLAKFADSQISASAVEGATLNFLVLDDPQMPTAPVRPGKRALVMPPMLGLATGFLVSSLAFVIYWRLDRRIHLPDDLSFLGSKIPVMTLPAVKSRGRKWPSRFVRIAAALQNGVKPGHPAVIGE